MDDVGAAQGAWGYEETGRWLLAMSDDASVEAERVIKAARRLAKRKGRAELVLAGALARLELDEGRRAFAEDVEAELGVKYRKAMYLVAIHQHFHAMGIDERRLATMGWSKANELLGVARPENFADLPDFAEANKRTDLIVHLNANYGRLGSVAKSGARTGGRMSFNLSPAHAKVVRRALDLAQEKLGIDDAGEALACICEEWLLVTSGHEFHLPIDP